MQAIIDKAKQVRLLILDVDGVLTSGIIFYGNNNSSARGFHIQDGLGIKLLQKSGVKIAVISAKHSEEVHRRLTDLNVQHIFLGHENKLPVYENLKQTLQLNDEEIAYVGDDLPDLPVLTRVGLAITVPAASAFVVERVHYQTKNQGGAGAVREVCELILKAQNQYDTILKTYLS